MTAQRRDRPVCLTALYREHLALGAVMEERSGWLLPVSYGDPAAEAAALRDAVGVMDIGDMGKIDVQGTELDAVLGGDLDPGGSDHQRRADPRSSGPPPPPPPPDESEGGGTLRYGAVPPYTGSEPEPGGHARSRPLRLTEEHVMLLTQPEDREEVLAQVRAATASHSCAHAVDLTGGLCGLRLAGPAAPALLERLCALDLTPERFADGSVVEGAVARVHAIVTRRDGKQSHGYDIFVDRDLGPYLWEAVLEEGAPLGLRPVGRSVEDA